MRIANNITALSTYNAYTKNNGNISKSVKKLSTGYQINSAADNAAGLAISEKMRAQIRGLEQASKNSQDAISLVQTAEGALQSTHDILQRMRELAVQSASDTNEQTIDRAAIQQEFEQLQKEIDDIATSTRFNDQNLLDGTFQKYTSTLGDNGVTDAKLNSISVAAAKAGEYVIKAEYITAVTASVTPGKAATATAQAADGTSAYAQAGAIKSFTFNGVNTDAHNGNTYYIEIDGSDLANMTFTLRDSAGNVVATAKNVDTEDWVGDGTTDKTKTVNFEGVGSIDFVVDMDFDNLKSSDLTALTGNNALKFTTVGETPKATSATPASVKLTINGEAVELKMGDDKAIFSNNGITISFKDKLSDADLAGLSAFTDATGIYTGDTIGVYQVTRAALTIQTGANQGDELKINIDAMNTEKLGVKFSSVDTQKAASAAITQVNNAINQVSTQRSALGALQNRLEFKISNLDTSAENLTSAESLIRDVDMAKEMTTFTNANILQQAATAMLAQANALPQNVLSLLG